MDHQVATIAAADWERFEAWALAPARDVLALHKLADDDRPEGGNPGAGPTGLSLLHNVGPSIPD